MILKEINFSTGPTALHESVRLALTEDPISHRCEEFKLLMHNICSLYIDHFDVKEVLFLTGSGTTANEAMLQQLKMQIRPGLILSNGEFGNRLINQALTNDLDFVVYKKPFGVQFEIDEIEQLLKQRNIHWILFTHCETSTGIINNLNAIAALCKKYEVLCFVDCISSVGAFKINLSQVAMATASSGKGLCGIAGLAVVFSNIQLKTNNKIPSCLDLIKYSEGKVPFTISSGMLKALYTGSKLKLNSENYDCIAEGSNKITHLLEHNGFKTFNAHSHVFTIISDHPDETIWLANELKKHGLITSSKSEYLQKNNWLQIALFGVFSNNEMRDGVNRLKSFLACKVLS
jgi:aspartate aminotransferase-like enzyme